MGDAKLSKNFSLYELTVTENAALQDKNRDLSDEQLQKLTLLALHCEQMRELCGKNPLRIHSGYRSPALNGATKGSSSTSQHPRCEAVDFDVPGQTIEDTFNSLLEAARAGRFKFGQLIIEEAKRFDGSVKWVHCSVIGTLDPAKVGQVMRMKSGADGKPVYTLIDTIKFA